MRRVAAKFVPKLLNFDQKQHRINIAKEILASLRNVPNLLQRVITGDESWIYVYEFCGDPSHTQIYKPLNFYGNNLAICVCLCTSSFCYFD